MMAKALGRTVCLTVALLWTLAPHLQTPRAQALDPIVYTVRFPEPEKQYADIEAIVPTSRAVTLDLMMPIWSPGYYRVEDYAARVEGLTARSATGTELSTEKTDNNRWRIQTGGSPSITLSYRVICRQRSVTTNWVDANYAVLNGAPTFVTLVEKGSRPHEVRLELPAGWEHAMTGLAPAPGGKPHHFRAADYETLVDSPILAANCQCASSKRAARSTSSSQPATTRRGTATPRRGS